MVGTSRQLQPPVRTVSARWRCAAAMSYQRSILHIVLLLGLLLTTSMVRAKNEILGYESYKASGAAAVTASTVEATATATTTTAATAVEEPSFLSLGRYAPLADWLWNLTVVIPDQKFREGIITIVSNQVCRRIADCDCQRFDVRRSTCRALFASKSLSPSLPPSNSIPHVIVVTGEHQYRV